MKQKLQVGETGPNCRTHFLGKSAYQNLHICKLTDI